MIRPARNLLRTILTVAQGLASLVLLGMRSRAQLAAEILFLRKQLALYMERRVKPRRADDATRIILVGLSRIFEWRNVQQLGRRPPRPVLNDLTDHLE